MQRFSGFRLALETLRGQVGWHPAWREAAPKAHYDVVDAPDTDVIGYEVVLRDNQAIGYCTSGSWGHHVGKSLAAGYVPPEMAQDGARFHIDILGQHCPAVVTARAAGSGRVEVEGMSGQFAKSAAVILALSQDRTVLGATWHLATVCHSATRDLIPAQGRDDQGF